MPHLSVRIENDDLERLQEQAQLQKISASAYVRRLIVEHQKDTQDTKPFRELAEVVKSELQKFRAELESMRNDMTHFQTRSNQALVRDLNASMDQEIDALTKTIQQQFETIANAQRRGMAQPPRS